ncbi:plasmid maintenance protein (plasmid) [Borrelia puertoricensis]|uniref:plasmid maintenance protein n=1 Tax=Borrelia puertoricensis TaxID=2756107 RepID=UPI003EB9981D
MSSTKKPINKHQHKLIVLVSTLDYVNLNLNQYSQSNILYYFNNNMKKNDQKPIKLKTLQSYLYKLEKVFKVTINYYKHLGVNMGTEIHYELKYSKKECYRIINKHFRDKKEERHKNRVSVYLEKTCTKNSSVEKWECINNIYNSKEEDKNNVKSIEKLQVKKYAKKCNFKSNAFLSILNLEANKDFKIQLLKAIKIAENSGDKRINNIKPNHSKLKSKQKELSKILNEIKATLENEGYDTKQLETQIQNVYEQYKNKPHFIIEKDKYNDLKKIIGKLKKTVKHTNKNTQKNERDIKNNVFSILLDQLRYKVDVSVLVPILKNYLSRQNKLEYDKVFSNHYYYELLELLEDNKNYLQLEESKKITS